MGKSNQYATDMTRRPNSLENKPLIVVHVVATLDIGGIERWLLELARFNSGLGENDRLEMHVVSLLSKDGILEKPLNEAGVETHHAGFSWRSPFASFRRLLSIIRRLDAAVVHCHADYLAGFVLPAALLSGCSGRITHLHNTKFAFGPRHGMVKRCVGSGLRASCLLFSTSLIGCSRAALHAFGITSLTPTTRVIHCSVPLERIHRTADRDREKLRHALGWAANTKIVLHVGRHGPAKNLGFALDVFREASEREPNLRLALAGSGELTEQLIRTAREMGIHEKVEFLGSREDVFDLMVAADIMLFPSLYEGLPVTLVEAQACGLPILMSDSVTDEVVVITDLVTALSLSCGVAVWAESLIERLHQPRIATTECIAVVEGTDFNLSITHQMLRVVYC